MALSRYTTIDCVFVLLEQFVELVFDLVELNRQYIWVDKLVIFNEHKVMKLRGLSNMDRLTRRALIQPSCEHFD
jgi:hypothetical protein